VDLDIRKAIVTKLTNITGEIYYNQIPEGIEITKPYVIFEVVASSFSKDTETKFAEYYLQFAIYDNGSTATVVETLAKSILDALDGAESSMPIGTHYLFAIDATRPTRTIFDSGYWIAYLEFKLQMVYK
jgi:hypothetical protein